MEKLGLGPEVLCAKQPKLVYARLTGYGQEPGLCRDWAGHDINYIAIAGALTMIGRKEDTPYAPLNYIGLALPSHRGSSYRPRRRFCRWGHALRHGGDTSPIRAHQEWKRPGEKAR